VIVEPKLTPRDTLGMVAHAAEHLPIVRPLVAIKRMNTRRTPHLLVRMGEVETRQRILRRSGDRDRTVHARPVSLGEHVVDAVTEITEHEMAMGVDHVSTIATELDFCIPRDGFMPAIARQRVTLRA